MKSIINTNNQKKKKINMKIENLSKNCIYLTERD